MTGAIIGWSHTKFGKIEDRTVEDLICEVAAEALVHAALEPKDVDAIYVGQFNGGFVRQEFPASLVLGLDPAMRFKPATRVENACATGSAAIHQGLHMIAAKRARRALVIGVEKMSEVPGDVVAETLIKCAYLKEEGTIEGGFTGIFGRIAQSYFQKYGDQSDALARIAAKNHRNGAANPLAQLRKDLGYEFCRAEGDKNPFVAGPLKRTDCALVSDGAAALVLADADTAETAPQAIGFRAAEHVNDFFPMSKRDVVAFEGCAEAWRRARHTAGIEMFDLDLVETHDCFTIAELLEYEAMGLAPAGRGGTVVTEGVSERGGRLPVNPSGGLKSKGHPIGATGVSMHALACMQLAGTAGDVQIKDAELAGIFNMGGAAVANYVSVLERLR